MPGSSDQSVPPNNVSASTKARWLKATPQLGLSDVTNISTARRHGLFSVKSEKETSTNTTVHHAAQRFKDLDAPATPLIPEEDDYPSIEYCSPPVMPSVRDLFDVRIDPAGMQFSPLCTEGIEKPVANLCKQLYILYEAPTGYAVFEQTNAEEIGIRDLQLQKSYTDFSVFKNVVKLLSFAPFRTAEEALENCNCVSEGSMSDYLRNFLAMTFEKPLKKMRKRAADDSAQTPSFQLGVCSPALGGTIHEVLSIPVVSNEHVLEMVRFVRLHCSRYLPNHGDGEMERAQLGLTHAYSRNKVQFNINRVDNMILQSSALLEHMDKGINQLAMRVKEWYGWHFPELVKIVPDVVPFAKIALALGDRNTLESKASIRESIETILVESELDPNLVDHILQTAGTSMGTDVSEIDMTQITTYAQKVIDLVSYKARLYDYLCGKLKIIAPNLTALLDERLAAKLISHTGSLKNLAKSPASTIQILGAEKALFRALKKKGNTPKYGHIFNSTFISRASKENKGRISRYLANKSALAARIDCFMDTKPTSIFGTTLRSQLEDRLQYLQAEDKSAVRVKSNKEAIQEAIEQYKQSMERRMRKKKQRTEAQEQAGQQAVNDA